MKNDFFAALKEGFSDNITNFDYYTSLVDNYTALLKCGGKNCNGMSEIKKGFAYLADKYNSLLKLKNQNEEIFSQILHDIKSPLIGVKFALETKQRSELDNEIYKINIGVLDLISDFLLLYSFSEGYKKLSFSNFSPCDIIENQINMYNSFLKQKKLKVDFKKEYEGEIFSNRQIFSRIVSNLISNALKYSPGHTTANFKLYCRDKTVIFQTKNNINQICTKDKSSFGLGHFIIKRLATRIDAAFCHHKTAQNKIIYEIKIPKRSKITRQGR